MKLTYVQPGKWELHGVYPERAFAVRIARRPWAIWEIQNEQGAVIFGDGFEGLRNVRAYFEMYN